MALHVAHCWRWCRCSCEEGTTFPLRGGPWLSARRFTTQHTAAVTSAAVPNRLQRGDSGLQLNVHFHVLALDGVYVRKEPSAPLVFHPLPSPTVDEVTDFAKRTALRVKGAVLAIEPRREE